MKLVGTEVKSLRQCRGSLEGSFISVRAGELWLKKSHIPVYQEKNTPKSYNPDRERKLLLKKSDIQKIVNKIEQKGLTLVPVEIHTRANHTIGITIALVKRSGEYENRQKIKARDTTRELQREFKGKIKV